MRPEIHRHVHVGGEARRAVDDRRLRPEQEPPNAELPERRRERAKKLSER